jgi:hypothetical protein
VVDSMDFMEDFFAVESEDERKYDADLYPDELWDEEYEDIE